MIVLQAVADGRLGGGTTHVLQLIETLREQLPAELHLVSQSDSPVLAEAAARGAVVHGVDFFAARLDPRVWVRLTRLVRTLRPDLIHAHGARACLPLTYVAAQAPLLYSVHGYHFVGKTGPAQRLARLAEQRCAACADLTLFVAEHDRELAARSGILERCRAHRVIRNGIDLRGLAVATGGDGRTLGYLGRLSEEKNPLLLLELLARLRADGFRLVVVGDGPLREVMRQKAEAEGLALRIAFTGALPRAQALAEIARTDALIVPSLWEGLPLAPLEAMAMGVPVIASAVGGLPEMIQHGVSGLLIDPPDADGFATAVRSLAAAPALRARIVAQARQRVADSFSWQSTRQAYLDLYAGLLAQR